MGLGTVRVDPARVGLGLTRVGLGGIGLLLVVGLQIIGLQAQSTSNFIFNPVANVVSIFIKIYYDHITN